MSDTVQYYNHENVYAAANKVVVDLWKPRPDLTDFPNAFDPILPVEFDRDYDLKYHSQLKQALNNPDIKWELRHLMKKYKITLNSVISIKN